MNRLERSRHVLRFLGGLEWSVLDAVAVYLADVEVLFYFGDVFGGDAIGCSPDSGWSGCMLKIVRGGFFFRKEGGDWVSEGRLIT